MGDTYFHWLTAETQTRWWHDSADPEELRQGLARAASGVTTNPVLTYQTLRARGEYWRERVAAIARDYSADERAEALVKRVVKEAADLFYPVYERTAGADGYVCGQVNPLLAAEPEAMVAMGKRYHAHAPNICVKLPVTAAGLEAVEECVAEGMSINGTVSFTVPQAIAVAERCQRGVERAKRAGKTPRPTFCTLMVGRLDDYLRDIARDAKSAVTEEDVRRAGMAVAKRAYDIYQERGFQTTLIIAALRGAHHIVPLAGAKVVLSVHPKVQDMVLQDETPREGRVQEPVPQSAIQRLRALREFDRAFEPDGMRPDEFMAYGLTQRTLTQFCEAGWLLLQSFTA